MSDNLIFELDENVKEKWKSTISYTRTEIVCKPSVYVERAIDKLQLTADDFKKSTSKNIAKMRELAWEYYVEDEALFHRAVLLKLIQDENLPKSILKHSVNSHIDYSEINLLNENAFLDSIANVASDYTGRIMPYIYELSLSTTNSRRSRSGATFEEIIYHVMRILDYPYIDQSNLGRSFFNDFGLGKKVDMIIPSKEAYARNRNLCHIVTMKTSLRERWQEVVEEISRTNIPHIYLLTLDSTITSNTLKVLSNHNITIVTYISISEKNENYANIKSFENYFNKDIPHLLSYL